MKIQFLIQQLAHDQNWAKAAPWLGLVTGAALFLFLNPAMPLFWALVNIPLYLFHQTEEHYWPGGFKQFMNEVINKLPPGEEKLTDIMVFWINILFVWVAFTIFGLLAFIHIGFGLMIVIFSIINCLTHIGQSILLWRWNPGLLMASLQFLISLYAGYFITTNGLANPFYWWFVAIGVAVVVHLILFKKISN